MTEAIATMSNQIEDLVPVQIDQHVIESLALKGDLSGLTPPQKVEYYGALCHRLKLDPATQPFLPLTLNGKEILYASKGCADQLSRVHSVNRMVTDRQVLGTVYVVTVRAEYNGRTEDATGAVPITNGSGNALAGEALANAYMKAETKAKRRATLSILGLGMLDETEIESIPAASKRATEFAGVATPDLATADIPPAEPPPPFDPIARSLNYVVTAKQLGMIRGKMRGLGILENDLDAYVGRIWPGVKLDEISKKAASILIDHLSDLEAGGSGTLEVRPVQTSVDPPPIDALVDQLSTLCRQINALKKEETPAWTPELLVEFVEHVSGEKPPAGLTGKNALPAFSMKALLLAREPLEKRLEALQSSEIATPAQPLTVEEEEAAAIRAEAATSTTETPAAASPQTPGSPGIAP